MEVPGSLCLSLEGDTVGPVPCWLQGTEVLATAVNPLQNCFGEEGELLWSGEGRSACRPLPGAELGCEGGRPGSESKAQSESELQPLPQTPFHCLLWLLREGEGSLCLQAVWEEQGHTCDSVPFTCSLLSLCLGPWHRATPVLQVCISAGITTVGGPKPKKKTKIRIGLQPLPLPSSANLSPVRSPSSCLVKSVGKWGKTAASFPCLG